jgi:HAD superfamily hydrolase (TIGR01509 family)
MSAPTPALVADTTARLLARMVELFSGDLHPRPGALELLTALQAADVPTALVSSSYSVLVDAVLARLAVQFDVTLAGDEVTLAKPDPEPYLTACSQLGTAPATTVVLEDSPAGVASAEAAGCAVVAVPSVEGVAFAPGPRRWVTPSLTEVDVPGLGALVQPCAPPGQGRPRAR